MRRLVSALLSTSLLIGCGPAESETSSPSLEQQQSPLTTTDVDVAPECQGILTFLNSASAATLGAYVPSNVVSNLVAARTASPFTTMAQVASVSSVGPARLTQLEGGARAQGFITSSCLGILDEVALSVDDGAALVSLVNSVGASSLHAILPNAWTGAYNLLQLRPFASAQAISATSGIGSASLRSLRNAANLGYAVAELFAAVNAQPESNWTSRLSQNFSAESILAGAHGSGGELRGGTCFGIDPSLYPATGTWTTRSNLATGAEVVSQVQSTVGYAQGNGPISPAVVTAGIAELQANTANRTFKGCQLAYRKGPWAGIAIHFYIDTASDYRVLSVQHWVE
ncbi:hypothetical protein [Comamonas sp. JC664]|uniref:hypothetical protein n=1 Tax=Comamonas sp. JC664 TaxID=2801917 RepID=UPI00174DF5E3|nr:hypothetical protein [Comamonas sp. JC664]MBL0697967.1 hypothetical protein [Comamonas sp. JC664]GHG70596.1 hypothetical protein GCM10012319_15660 [Comamonas sp. KCTC 72670]